MAHASFPVWYKELHQDLTAMAEALPVRVTGWQEHSFIVTPEEMGYAGGLATEAIQAAIDKAAAAGGGTVLHAKGTGMEHAEQFLGFSLASEKEAVLIVVPTAKKNDIMKAVMEQAGLTTDAKAIAFSLPVTSVAGMRLMEEEQET